MPPTRYVRDRTGDRPRILANRYEVCERLGTGTFGTVFMVKDIMCDEETKVSKEISLGDLKPDETVDAIREAKLLSRLDHPGIVKFYDSFVDGEFFCIITEYCEGGDLADKIELHKKNNVPFKECDILTWFVQLVLAVQYMHSRRVLHRDIKTRNIFLKDNMVKLGDFGISRILMGTTDLASTFVGTPYFMSPEVLKHEGYNSSSDVWSVGCILYELCTHEHAFSGQSLMSVMYRITEGKITDLPDRYSSKLNQLYKRMLHKNPKDRPSAKDITKLPFIANHITEMLKSVSAYTTKQNCEENCQNEADDIAQLLDSKSRLEDLVVTDSTTLHLATLTPTQIMKVKKEKRADAKAAKLGEVAHEQLKENYARKQAIKTHNLVSHIPAWQGGQGDGEKLRAALTVKEVSPNKRDKSKPLTNNNHLSPSSTTQYIQKPTIGRSMVQAPINQTVQHPTYTTIGRSVVHTPINQHHPPNTNHPTYTIRPQLATDDRPITPMKNTMIYDLKNSSLDFKDGIPDEAELADTYYSQFDDFEGQADDVNNSDDDHEESLDDMTLTPCIDDLDMTHDVQSYITCLEGALTTSDNESTLVLDDREGGAFGPGIRNIKIKNLTAECERILGKAAFESAYNYLKKARYSQSVGTMDESGIFQGLRQFVTNPGDCFLIDQLLFLEEQAKVSMA